MLEKDINTELKIYTLSGLTVRHYPTLDSTSTEARRRILNGHTEPCVIVADTQTEGRGRTGRSFSSPRGGLYFSLSMKNTRGTDNIALLTAAAAVALRRAIYKVCRAETDIKWVNDLYFHGKKAAGILTECLYVDGQGYIIIGMGVNLSGELPRELFEIATTLSSSDGLRIPLMAEVLAALLPLYTALPDSSFMEEYRKYSCVIGRELEYTKNGQLLVGYASHIDNDGALYIETESGTQRITSGEISFKIRSKDGN